MNYFRNASQANRAAKAAADKRRVWYVVTSRLGREPKTRPGEKTKREGVKPCED